MGHNVSHMHIRYINPLPRNVFSAMENFTHILVPELNRGQLRFVLSAQTSRELRGLNKIQGQPFKVSELIEETLTLLEGEKA